MVPGAHSIRLGSLCCRTSVLSSFSSSLRHRLSHARFAEVALKGVQRLRKASNQQLKKHIQLSALWYLFVGFVFLRCCPLLLPCFF